jgi:hypothetical protein
MHWSLHRWVTCRGTSTRHISSALASLLSCHPSAQLLTASDAHHFARWQLHIKQQAICYPTSSVSIRPLASRSTKNQRSSNAFRAVDYDSIDDLLRDSIDVLNSGGRVPTAAVWSRISRLMPERQPRQNADNLQLEQGVDALFRHTMDSLGRLKPKDLTTIILSMAKIAKNVSDASRRKRVNNYQRAFGSILPDRNLNPSNDLFLVLAKSADHLIAQFEPRCLSNLAYAYALLGHNPQLDKGCTLLENIANISITCIRDFNPQELANTVWAYATAGVQHPALFNKLGDDVVSLNNLKSFKPQALANIIWAFATACVKHPALFKKVGDHVVALDNLKPFDP